GRGEARTARRSTDHHQRRERPMASTTSSKRIKANQSNAQRSCGPRTDAGKLASRKNAMTHGLCAVVLSAPNEDPRVAPDRSDAWVDFYQPQSPAAHHLVNECVRATLRADRVDRCHTAIVAKQVREAEWADDRR